MWGAVGRVLALFVPLAALLAIAAMLPSPSGGAAILIGPVHRVVTESYVFEPDIAVDPTNPNHLAATVASADNRHCGLGCTSTLLLATSADSGATWTERRLTDVGSIDGTVAFATNGALYEAGILFNPTFTAFIHQGLPRNAAGSIHPTTFLDLGVDKTWLTIAPGSGAIYLTYTVRNTGNPPVYGRVIKRSTDGGKTWMITALPFDSQGAVLAGSAGDVALASWTQASGPLTLGKVNGHVARSSDGGKTFSAPSLVDAAWGSLGEAAGAGTDYLAYAAGEQQAERLVVATSRDGGTTWRQTTASGIIPFFFAPIAPAPALGVAPDGTVDLVFYAATSRCTDPVAFQHTAAQGPHRYEPWIDPCTYNVYYTFSTDKGMTWAAPTRLNKQSVVGKQAVRIPSDRSRLGEYIGVASTDHAAYPLWIATNATGTEADTARIRR